MICIATITVAFTLLIAVIVCTIPAAVFYGIIVASQALHLQNKWHLQAAGAGLQCVAIKTGSKKCSFAIVAYIMVEENTACCTLPNSEPNPEVSDTTDA